MKKALSVAILMAMVSAVSAQVQLPLYRIAAGTWRLSSDRLYQSDISERLAKINFLVPQRDVVIYDLNVRYEGGLEDGHGGFGIHVFADPVLHQRSWGNGKSWMFWLNYDEAPQHPSIPPGLSAQIYQSKGHSVMELVHSFDLNQYRPLITPAVLASPLPIKIQVDSTTGAVRFYDPATPGRYWSVVLDGFPESGEWLALRSNGIAVSFGLPK